MDRIKWLGIFALAGGLIVLGYQGIESIMSEGAKFVDYTPISVFGEDAFGWIESVPGMKIRDALYYITESPLYSILLIVGTAFLMISGIFGKK